jgi:hypothetical protein
MRWRAQTGQTVAEYMGALLVVSVVIAAVGTSDIGAAIDKNVRELICRISGGECDTADAAQTALIERRMREITPWADARGGRHRALLDAAEDALARGDLHEANRLLDLLGLYRQLGDGVRGDAINALTSPDDAAFRALIEAGTTYQEDGKYNRRYLQLPPAPGEGVLVYDFYIPFGNSFFLKGDDRGVSDPLLGEYGMDRSRMMLVIDRESGRGVLVQSETCTVVVKTCNEPRPITFDMDDDWENDSGHDATGEGINIDQTNQFEIDADRDSVKLTYDALNSITPLGVSVDGTVEIHRQPDGTYKKGVDTRDDYPAKALYHYRPGHEPDEVHDHKDVNPDNFDGALPKDPDIKSCSNRWIRLPFPCPDFN